MIEVFRVEHRDTGIGPFQTQDPYLQDLAKRAGRIGYLRNPYDDGLGLAWIPHAFVFGCPSLRALKRWVLLGGTVEKNEAIVRGMTERGFVVAEYLVEQEDCRQGISGLQLAFNADWAREEGLVQYHEMRSLLAEPPLVFCLCDREVAEAA